MKTFLCRCYHKGRAFGVSLKADGYDEAAKIARQRGWVMEEVAARRQ